MSGRKRSRKKPVKGTKRGHPPFRPTPSEKAFVAAMAGMKMTVSEICAVIGAGRNGVDGVGGKPIGRHTLYRNFRREMANGGALLRARITRRFYEALDRGEQWAVIAGLRNRMSWLGYHQSGTVGSPADDGDIQPLVQVEFVVPSGRREEERPAPVPGQRLLPPPPQLERNEFGVWEEFRNGGGTRDRPPKPGDWMR